MIGRISDPEGPVLFVALVLARIGTGAPTFQTPGTCFATIIWGVDGCTFMLLLPLGVLSALVMLMLLIYVSVVNAGDSRAPGALFSMLLTSHLPTWLSTIIQARPIRGML